MLSADDIRKLCLRKYHAYLRSTLGADTFFPLKIRFGRPTTTAQWNDLQRDIAQLVQSNPGYQIDWEEINTRKWGRQRLPSRVWFENETDYLRAINKTGEAALFRHNAQLACKDFPRMKEWFSAHISVALEHAEAWPPLLQVCRYFCENPRPNCYAREIPLPIGTKFIEDHCAVLRSLLDFLLPPESIAGTTDHFETRFGLRYDETLVRMRILDSALKTRLHLPANDLSMPQSQFNALNWSGHTLIIVENKMTFLTLPELGNSLGIWGMGNAAALLEKTAWLANCTLYYWGDLDVHGFHILSRLRRTFPSMQSLMMDEHTLASFKDFWQTAGDAAYEKTQNLTAEEQKTYVCLKNHKRLLEQERVTPAYSKQHLSRLVSSC